MRQHPLAAELLAEPRCLCMGLLVVQVGRGQLQGRRHPAPSFLALACSHVRLCNEHLVLLVEAGRYSLRGEEMPQGLLEGRLWRRGEERGGHPCRCPAHARHLKAPEAEEVSGGGVPGVQFHGGSKVRPHDERLFDGGLGALKGGACAYENAAPLVRRKALRCKSHGLAGEGKPFVEQLLIRSGVPPLGRLGRETLRPNAGDDGEQNRRATRLGSPRGE